MDNYYYYYQLNGCGSQPVYIRQPRAIVIHSQQRQMPITLDIPPQNIILKNDEPQPIIVRQQNPNVVIQNSQTELQETTTEHTLQTTTSLQQFDSATTGTATVMQQVHPGQQMQVQHTQPIYQTKPAQAISMAHQTQELQIQQTAPAHQTQQLQIQQTAPAHQTQQLQMQQTAPAHQTQQLQMQQTAPAHQTQQLQMQQTAPAHQTQQLQMQQTTPAHQTQQLQMQQTMPSHQTQQLQMQQSQAMQQMQHMYSPQTQQHHDSSYMYQNPNIMYPNANNSINPYMYQNSYFPMNGMQSSGNSTETGMGIGGGMGMDSLGGYMSLPMYNMNYKYIPNDYNGGSSSMLPMLMNNIDPNNGGMYVGGSIPPYSQKYSTGNSGLSHFG